MLKHTYVSMAILLMVGCASVPMQDVKTSGQAKAFNAPTNGNAGLYVYRDTALGSVLKKDVWVDGKCLGETAPKIFFFKEVAGNQKHVITTESEFGNQDLWIDAKAGENHFVKQVMRPGVFVAGAYLKEMEAEKGMKEISKLSMAQTGKCSKALIKK